MYKALFDKESWIKIAFIVNMSKAWNICKEERPILSFLYIDKYWSVVVFKTNVLQFKIFNKYTASNINTLTKNLHLIHQKLSSLKTNEENKGTYWKRLL